MRTPGIKNDIKLAILALLALTPIFNIFEISTFISGNLENFASITTPLYIKLIKDIGFLIVFILCFLNLRKPEKHTVKRLIFFSTPLLFLIATLFILSYMNDPLEAMAGLRWISPLLLALFLIGNIDDNSMTEIAKLVSVVFLLSFAIQVLELIKTKPLWGDVFFRTAGHNLLGMPRLPGIFMNPNTTGFFICLAMFLGYFYIEKSKLRTLILSLIPISIVLCGSGTAIIVYVATGCVFLIRKKITMISISSSILIIVITVLTLPFITGRQFEYRNIFNSATGRVKVFSVSAADSELISSRFGRGTNTMHSIAQKFHLKNTAIKADSTVTAVIINIGLVGFLIFTLAYILWTVRALRSNRLDAIIFTLIYTLFAFTISIAEAFPMNLLFAVGVAYFIPIIYRFR